MKISQLCSYKNSVIYLVMAEKRSCGSVLLYRPHIWELLIGVNKCRGEDQCSYDAV